METRVIYYSDLMKKIINNISKVIIGKEEVSKLLILSMISDGHVLLEDIPGVGKTSLVSALSKSISCDFNRIQFTPDILPSDITGFSILNPKTNEFEFKPGAVMSNFVLADEINRASAKAQSSLLEVMEEGQVTVDSTTYKLEEPFMVLATQNPVDTLGTYSLPEAQLDRFQIKVSLGYPTIKEEIEIISLDKDKENKLEPVVSKEEILEIKEYLPNIRVDYSVKSYIVNLINKTRENKSIKLGVSPRGSIALYRMSKANAIFEGRNYVVPDDVKYLAKYVLPHRIILTNEAKLENIKEVDIINNILTETPIKLI